MPVQSERNIKEIMMADKNVKLKEAHHKPPSANNSLLYGSWMNEQRMSVMLTSPFPFTTTLFKHESRSKDMELWWPGRGKASDGRKDAGVLMELMIMRWGARRWRWCRPTGRPWTRTAPLLPVGIRWPLKQECTIHVLSLYSVKHNTPHILDAGGVAQW